MQLKGNRVLILPEEASNVLPSGIFIPDTVKQKRNIGLVVLIGDTVPIEYDKRRVLFNKLVETDIEYEGLKCSLLFYPDIIAILDN